MNEFSEKKSRVSIEAVRILYLSSARRKQASMVNEKAISLKIDAIEASFMPWAQ